MSLTIKASSYYVEEGGKVEIKITNNYSETRYVKVWVNITTSSGTTTKNLGKFQLNPGESRTITYETEEAGTYKFCAKSAPECFGNIDCQGKSCPPNMVPVCENGICVCKEGPQPVSVRRRGL